MRTTDLALDALGRVHELIPVVLADLTPADLVWRPDEVSNPMGWLVWHLTRGEDDHISDLGGVTQLWHSGWKEQFDLPYPPDSTGYQQTPGDVAAFHVDGPDVLVGYAAAVWQQTQQVLRGLSDEDYDRIVDRSWNPPVTLSVRLVSVINETAQHIGQVGYLRGMVERARGTNSASQGHP